MMILRVLAFLATFVLLQPAWQLHAEPARISHYRHTNTFSLTPADLSAQLSVPASICGVCDEPG